MPALIVQFVALAAAVAVAGTFLARSADQIAKATRLGRVFMGSVLLAVSPVHALTAMP
jgi:Ca2+/Na+ antiporter